MSRAIYSTAEKNFKGIFLFAVIWNLFSFFIAFVILREKFGWPVAVESIQFNDPVFLILLFPLVGIYLAGYALKQYRQWKKYGRLELYLNPEQGSIGGDVGGELDLPLPYRTGNPIKVTVSCINTTISSSSDQGSHRHDKLIWRKSAAVDSRFSGKGTRIQFVLPIDEDLPATTTQSGDYIHWIVRVQDHEPESSCGHPLDRKFEIPVVKHDPPQKCTLRVHSDLPVINSDEIPQGVVTINETGEQLTLFYPRFRSKGMAFSLLLFSLLFLGPAMYLLMELMRNQDGLFQTLILSAMMLVFGLFGLLLLLMGLDLLTNKMSVTVTRNEIRTRKQSFFVFNFQNSFRCAELSAVKLKINMSSGQGTDAMAYYQINAESADQGSRVNLGDGIQGRLSAEALAKRIIAFTGRSDIPIENDVTKGRGRKKKNTAVRFAGPRSK